LLIDRVGHGGCRGPEAACLECAAL
jgi:hypothetical protein